MKHQKPKYSTPLKPWNRERIERERKLMADYGLRRKKEVWKAEALLRDWRTRARELRAKKNADKEKILIDKLVKLGLVKIGAGLEDVLNLKVEAVLERRLQTLIMRKGLAATPKQARQLVIHGHVALDGQKLRWPSTLVPGGAEERLVYAAKSKFKAYREFLANKGQLGAKTAAAPAAPKEGGK
jgi:small subunit ribosomal protein S4